MLQSFRVIGDFNRKIKLYQLKAYLATTSVCVKTQVHLGPRHATCHCRLTTTADSDGCHFGDRQCRPTNITSK